MSLLKSMSTDANIAGERDSLGGSRLLESGAYKAKVEHAYVATSEGGALGLFLAFKTADGQEIRSTQWMTSGTAKGRKNTYQDNKGDTQYLPGFLMANSLALLTTGKEINQLDTEEKVIKLYNKEAKAEIPTKVQMITDMVGQDIVIGVVKQTVDKTVKNETTGQYEPNGETRDENEIDKFFCGKEGFENMTTTEIQAKATEASFYDKWVEKNAGVTRNKVKGASGTAGAPKPGAAAAAGTAKPKTSLFS